MPFVLFCGQNCLCFFVAVYAIFRGGGGKRSAVFVTECTMIEPTPLIRETEVV